ncbi:hypothetical protein LP418_00100 [Nocardioides sp. B-3]|nr:hypothetical protein [Nocardioides sp. B-3]UUZ59614.1 hypothetical protein LP418_00100 [Nocardioides sp. B-3]
MGEVLDAVAHALEERERRRAEECRSPYALDEVCVVVLADARRLALGQARQRRQHDAGRPDRAALADHRVGEQLAGLPVAAQRRRVRAELFGEVGEREAFTPGEGGHGSEGSLRR